MESTPEEAESVEDKNWEDHRRRMFRKGGECGGVGRKLGVSLAEVARVAGVSTSAVSKICAKQENST